MNDRKKVVEKARKKVRDLIEKNAHVRDLIERFDLRVDIDEEEKLQDQESQKVDPETSHQL